MRLLLLACLATVLVAADLPFKPPEAYACDVAFSDGKEKGSGRMVIGGPDKHRMEMKTDDGDMVMIMRQDQKKMYMLMPSEKMVMVMAFDPKQAQFKDPTRDPKATWKKTGTETVNSIACDVYQWTSGSDSGTAWIDAKRGVLVRTKDAKGKGQADFTNFAIGPQPADQFEPPKGWQQMQMPGMGGMMGGR